MWAGTGCARPCGGVTLRRWPERVDRFPQRGVRAGTPPAGARAAGRGRQRPTGARLSGRTLWRLRAAAPADEAGDLPAVVRRSEEHTSELQSLMRISYAVLCLKKNNTT